MLGVYVLTDRARVFVLDHIQADIAADTDAVLVLKLTNPTMYTAEVRVLAETSRQQKQSLGIVASERFTTVQVPAKGFTLVRIDKNNTETEKRE